MELPVDIQRLIKEHSMPITRPDWRTLHIMTTETYLEDYRIQHKDRLRYINSYPERHIDVVLFERLVRYKNVFCGYRYSQMIRLLK